MMATYIQKPSDGTWWAATISADGGLDLTLAPGYVPPAPAVGASVSAGDIVRGSLRLIGARGSGEVPTASEMQDGLYALNSMLDSWANEKLMAYGELKQSFNLTGSKVYTMGLGGDFDAERPQQIVRAFCTLNGTEFEIPVLRDEEWQEKLPSTIGLHNDNAFPLANLDIQVPNGVTEITLYSWGLLPQFRSATDVVVLPPGYERAMRYGLAIEICPEYNKEASPTIVEIYRVAKANIKRKNSTTPVMKCDEAIAGRGRFDIVTGGIR